ncbi:MAG: HD domain-containing protein [Calditerrivibrio sp.]|nr:HD domain-containing protein [Calditerrivibrio sp.]
MAFFKDRTTYSNDLIGSYVISIFDLAYNISKIVDLVNPDLSNHHHRVAYISAAIASEYGLDNKKITDTIIAALIHDIGVMLESEFRELSKFDNGEATRYNHSNVGAFLVNKLDSFKHLSDIISKHHLPWNKFPETEDEALIIHLADRIDILLKRGTPAYYQRKEVKEIITSYKNRFFKPEHVDAFLSLYDKEFFWLDLEAPDKDRILKRYFLFDTIILSKDEILSFTNFLSHIIDFRCSFTATHSAGVASVASKLGELMNLPEDMVINLKIAGYLHDLGKLAINPYIINKNGQLSIDERTDIKKHTYYTFYCLNSMDIFENVKQWAAFHHEFLDGSGYPFHLTAERLDIGCRIMTVADIYTALSEDRPYRPGLPTSKALEIIENFASSGKIDHSIVKTLKNNIDEIENIRKLSQLVVTQKYLEFKNILMLSNVSNSSEDHQQYKTYSEIKNNLGQVINIIHFEEVINNIDDMILILDTDRRIIFVNRRVLEYFNKPLDQILNKKPGELFDCIHGNDDQCGTTIFCKNCKGNTAINNAIKGIYSISTCEIKTNRSDTMKFNISTVPIKTDKGEYIMYILKGFDEQNRKIMDKIFYHDLINVVGTTYSLLEAYKKGHLKMNADLLDILSNNIGLAYQEIEAQRFLTMAQQNNITTHFDDFSTHFIINNIKSIFSHINHITFEFICEVDRIFADKILLNRIVMNMVKNAIEASNIEKTITVKFYGDDKFFRVSVHNPEYIPEDIQKKIFKEVFTTKKEGNGLGTFCIKLLTEKYLGGHCSFISTLEYGTTFIVEFPNISKLV